MAHKLLENTHAHHNFVLMNGRVLKNIFELSNALTGMDDATFRHHVTKERNDFANWVEHVFHDKELAGQLRHTKTKDEMINRINKRIAALSKKTEEEYKTLPSAAAKDTPQPKEKVMGAKEEKVKKAAKEKTQKPKTRRKKQRTVSEKKSPDKKTDQYQELLAKIDEVLKREEEILIKEKEMVVREQKIEEVEAHLEQKLGHDSRDARFFSREFVQGLVTGFLITLIIGLVYLKYFYL
jgi:hypothetical protein